MNTTKDSKGNVLMYDEEAKTSVTTNEDNYYLKTNNNMHLLDKTEYITDLNKEKYNETFYILYPYLKDHLKLEDFKNLCELSNDVPKNQRRNLDLNQHIIQQIT